MWLEIYAFVISMVALLLWVISSVAHKPLIDRIKAQEEYIKELEGKNKGVAG